MKRKEFIKKTAGALFLAIPAYSLLNCSKSDDSEPDPPQDPSGDCGANGTNNAIGSNHGHSLSVSAQDVMAGAEKTYNIQGSSGHPHTIVVTASDFSSLQSNQQITVNSSNDDGHTHSVTISCA